MLYIEVESTLQVLSKIETDLGTEKPKIFASKG